MNGREIVITSDDGCKAVASDKLTALLLEAVKEQQDPIQTLKDSIKRLKEDVFYLNIKTEQIGIEDFEPPRLCRRHKIVRGLCYGKAKQILEGSKGAVPSTANGDNGELY